MRISAAQRTDNENRIRAAMDRLLRGEIPPGGKCDIKTLANEAAVDRTAFYGTRPYAHLRIECERRLQAGAGCQRDPRPSRGPDRPAQDRDHQAPRPAGPVGADGRRTHRLPRPGPGPARRPARGNRPAPRVRRRGEPSEPPARTTNHSDRRLQLKGRTPKKYARKNVRAGAGTPLNYASGERSRLRANLIPQW
jgi:hypothetical protein